MKKTYQTVNIFMIEVADVVRMSGNYVEIIQTDDWYEN